MVATRVLVWGWGWGWGDNDLMEMPGRSEEVKRKGRVERVVLGAMDSTLKICVISFAQEAATQ